MHIRCLTDMAVFLVGFKDRDGVLYFSKHQSGLAGIHIRNKRLHLINDQIMDRMKAVLGELGLEGKVSIIQEFADALFFESGESGTLYLGQFEGDVHTPDDNWIKIPDLLKSMPTDKNQVAYMRAFQVFAGGYSNDTKAVDLSDAIRHLGLD